ncbi:GNAT family N-acetyltransferase [Erwinia endophytica]|uniref:MSMEG_0567/Sll0786 family nitrogen starvation N-acetyltransferase n=1 Tax=Erwinia endophytica TaxID=1563158 RepID=UPI00126601E1|nr:MSMEG_0567/Sll0786 family nitrogen starvation N-acetyltransferase [Erwinia endophytica]KAB8312766.1 GNAT family N-acetyltransferase [Erwinia endophytica]
MFSYPNYTVKWVTLPWEREQAYALRRQIFCQEQALFAGDDRDMIDDHAQLLVALGGYAGWHEEVVGTVRIHRRAERVWFGSRLAVAERFRRQGQLGSALIRLAVSSANALGCDAFYADVQQQNEKLFRRLHWHTLDSLTLRGIPHVRMQADLTHYPPCHDPHSGMVLNIRPRISTGDLAPRLTGGVA